tara:strand:- start:50 stop:280 length:231 start_codon:yes stop_codon:yes gene_type:complete
MFEIYGTLNCVYCDMAKKLLAVYEKEYAFIDVIENDDITAAFFKKFPNVSQVPQITEGDEYVGGFNELKLWLNHTE